MNKTIYKQADSRWGSLSYPKGCTIAGCGCGVVACTHIAIEQIDKKSWTPKKLRKHMLSKGYAVYNNGTKWEGITETLKWLGHDKVVRIYNAPMSEAWKELNKGNRIGIILFNDSVAPNGVRWSSSGHYVAFTKYRLKNGLHQFYCKDSGWRSHDGWYSYEKSMRGCISKVWIVENIHPIIKTAKSLAWAKGTESSRYDYPKGSPTKAFKNALDKYYPKHNNWGKGPKTGASCDVFVGTAVRASGLDKKFPRGFDEQWKHNSKNFKKIVKYDVAPYDVTKPGDIILYHKNASGSSKHVLIRGKDCLYEAQHQNTYGHVNTSMSKVKKVRPKVVIFRAK